MTPEMLAVWEGKKVYAACIQHGPFDISAHASSFANFLHEASPLIDDGRLLVLKEFLQPIDYMRSWHAQTALYKYPDVTHVFYFDSDMEVSIDHLTALLKRGVDCISGTYFMGGVRTKEGESEERMLFRNFPCVASRAGEYITRQEIVDAGQKDALIQVDSCGAGCLLVTTEMLYKIGQPAFRMDWYIAPSFAQITYEDTFFAHRVINAGGTVWMDPLVMPAHFKMMRIGFAIEDMAGVLAVIPDDEPSEQQIRLYNNKNTPTAEPQQLESEGLPT